MASSKLLFNDPPLVVSPSLAVAVKSVDEAIVLQQVHYWLQTAGKERDGRLWIYNSVKEWQAQFPFWSEKSIRRIIDSLREKGLLLTANYNKLPMDRTLWYSIDYDKLSTYDQMGTPFAQTGNSICPNGVNHLPARGTAIPETTTETNNTKDVVVVGATLATVFQTWSNITKGTFNSLDSDVVKDLVDTHGAEAVNQAMLDANMQGKRTLAYVQGILRNRQNGTEKPQPQQRQQGNGERKSKVQLSLEAVDRVVAMAERGELDEWLK